MLGTALLTAQDRPPPLPEPPTPSPTLIPECHSTPHAHAPTTWGGHSTASVRGQPCQGKREGLSPTAPDTTGTKQHFQPFSQDTGQSVAGSAQPPVVVTEQDPDPDTPHGHPRSGRASGRRRRKGAGVLGFGGSVRPSAAREKQHPSPKSSKGQQDPAEGLRAPKGEGGPHISPSAAVGGRAREAVARTGHPGKDGCSQRTGCSGTGCWGQ